MRALLLLVLLCAGCGANAIVTQAEGDSTFEVAHAHALELIDAARQQALHAAATHGTVALHAERERWRPLAQLSDALREAEAAYYEGLDAQRLHGTPLDAALLTHVEALFADVLNMARGLGVQL